MKSIISKLFLIWILWIGVSCGPPQSGVESPKKSGITSTDRDGDSVMTGDNCPDKFNPDQKDQDLDAIGDACDSCTSVTMGMDLHMQLSIPMCTADTFCAGAEHWIQIELHTMAGFAWLSSVLIKPRGAALFEGTMPPSRMPTNLQPSYKGMIAHNFSYYPADGVFGSPQWRWEYTPNPSAFKMDWQPLKCDDGRPFQQSCFFLQNLSVPTCIDLQTP